MAGYIPQQYHLVPGRLRLKIASLKGSETRARLAETRVRDVDGVREVCANKLTGSLIVRFDPAIASVARIFDTLIQCDLIGSAPAPAVRTFPSASTSTQPALAGETVADALIGKAVEAILERCALALIAAVI
jgi:hypothetical protein